MIPATDLKRGDILELDNDPWQVTEVAMQTPSARGAGMVVKARLRNLRTGQGLARTWRSGDGLVSADVTRRAVQFLYRQGDGFEFMDLESFDQLSLTGAVVGEAAGYLLENQELATVVFQNRVMAVELPITVELTVTDTAPALKGATAQAQLKPATLETGLEVQVPPYVGVGERIRIDTRDGRFVERVR